MREIKYIVIHCTSGTPNQTTASIRSWWKDGLGWKKVGYHKLISFDGGIEDLAPLSAVTNGVQGYNQTSVHISYKGGMNGVDTRSIAQKESILKAINDVYKELSKTQDVGNIKIRGHRDFSPDTNKNGKVDTWEWTKDCPSFDASFEYAWIQGNHALLDRNLL
ncbi:N-acetylmuramoyl-L-alanine amidase [Sphingobacteriaceae bacterium WQ 2009]|uniref:N-acetylmuramoyl-L-alanine amidase n=1 Tax=Rhinopithecimicrobium faecis TaxID=2820698 RepID=A0A8T4HBB6_9SPHI|nr:N-acetylmuramoyl-L-alanine amidase [Sphingobacteriaceae bacterium WQ 2009]